jgi:hypothetical protein
MKIEVKKPLPELVSQLIRKYTNQIDIIAAAESKGISYEVLKRVVYRSTNVTAKNIKGLNSLLLVAQKNCQNHMMQAQKDYPIIKNLTENN